MAMHGSGIDEGAVSDFHRVGGGPAITALVERFCQLLLDDDRLSRYVADGDLPRLKRQQEQLISGVLGGPGAPADPQEQAWPEVSPDDLCPLVSYLVLAMQETGVDPEIIARTGPTLAAVEKDAVAVPAR
ncbi:MAG: globin domain-containing protein [Nocardioidaceae bacterium]